MTMSPTAAADARSVSSGRDDADRRRFVLLSIFAAIYTYALIVFGGIVRITGSGMGCGEDWPRCNGEWIPAFTFETMIEYGHRLLAAGLIVPIAAVVVLAWRYRDRPGFGGPGGALRPVAALAVLLALQILLGAVTVKLELPASTTVMHFVTASLMLGALLTAAVRASAPTSGPAHGAEGPDDARRYARAAYVAAGLGLLAVVFGALTANTGAAPLCQGFPLCNGQWMPEGGGYVHIHWTHRLFAFALFFHIAGAAILAWRRGAPAAIRNAALASLVLVVAQLAVAAALVSMRLPQSLQALHLALGAALWGVLALWGAVAGRRARERAGTPAPARA